MQMRITNVLVCATLVLAGIRISAAATIAGNVHTWLAGSEELVPGSRVTLSGPALPGKRVAIADEHGHYWFGGIPPGARYQLVAELEGFGAWPMTVEYLHFDEDFHADLPLDLPRIECTLGRQWQLPARPPTLGVFHIDPNSP